MTESSEGRGRYRDALRVADFRISVVAYILDEIGGWAYSVVIGVDVYGRTHSAAWLAAIGASSYAASVVASPYASVIADRYDRTQVMIVSALLSAVVMAGIAASVAAHGPVWTLLALAAMSAAARSPYGPAASALTPEIVPEKDLAAANSLFSVLESLTTVVGPAVGGLLLVVASPVAGVIVNAASFVLAAALIARLQVRSRGSAEPGTGIVGPWLDGIRALTSHRLAFVLVMFCALDAGVYGAASVIYVPLSVRLGTGLNGYSYLLAGNALGSVAAALVANRLSARPRLAGIIFACIVLQAVPFALTAAVHAPALAFVLQVASGVGEVIVDILALTFLQRSIERGALSRVFGVFTLLATLATIASSLGFAALLQAAGIVWALVGIGAVFPGLALLGLPYLRKGDSEAVEAAERIAPLVDVLAGLDLFTGSPRSVLERLALGGERREVPARTVIIKEGDPADALWILLSGSLTIRSKGNAERAKQLPTVSAPGYVGELGLVRHIPRTATVRAREACTLLRIDGETFLAAVEDTPPSASFVQLTGIRWNRTASRQPQPN